MTASPAMTRSFIRTRSRNKPLWIAISLLGAAVVALGGSLIYLQTRAPVEVRAVSAPNAPVIQRDLAPGGALQADAKTVGSGAPMIDEVEKPAAAAKEAAPKSAVQKADVRAKPVVAAKSPAQTAAQNDTASKPAVNPGAVVVAQAPAPVPAPAPKPVCVNCGTVEASNPITRTAAPSGVGVVAGGVLGAVLGNQVGGGSGKTAATVLGAVGGGWAGNEIEKNMKKATVYEVKVRLDNESLRTFELASPVGAGSKVTVEGNSLRLADGSLVSPLAARAATQNPSQGQSQTRSTPGPNQAGG